MDRNWVRVACVAVAGLGAPATAQMEGIATAQTPGVTPLGPGALLHPDVPPGYVIVEGDIQVTVAEYLARRSGADGAVRLLALWPTNVVPYDFTVSGNGSVTQAQANQAVAAMNAIAANVNIIFRPATGSESRIRFQSSTVNNSPIGYQGGVQTINIVSWSSVYTIAHEIYHSLGFFHEQSRPDRGPYITVHYENICGSGTSAACTPGTGTGQCCLCLDSNGSCTDCSFNFDVAANAYAYGYYDFDSVMHYGPGVFSCNGLPTITVNPPIQATIGQHDHLSYMDIIVCRGMYPSQGDRWWSGTATQQGLGTLVRPLNGSFLAAAVPQVPDAGTLFIRDQGSFAAIGTYTRPMTWVAPMGATLR